MTLHPPKKDKSGIYTLSLNPPISSPRLTYDSSWSLTPDWISWATLQRQTLIGELLSHGTWFSRPPRRDILESLFGPWAGKKSTQAPAEFFCKVAEAPVGPGTATWQLTGLTMSASSIQPIWRLEGFEASPEQDTISLFGDADTIEDSDELTREIRFDEIEAASPAVPSMPLRNREWEARKFLAKGRVREARLKAQIADRMAAKEESRFYTTYGELSDGESQFSEYDLTDEEGSETSERSPSRP
jgi:hypothetical protein